MADLSTQYLGLTLKNPLIASSSGLTNSTDTIERLAEAGIGAIVLKSLFEEQVSSDVDSQSEDYNFAVHPEAEEYVREMGKHLGPEEYLKLIRSAKQISDVPIIASMNCVSGKWWGNYARQIAEAGADAIELNISMMPRSMDERSDPIEKRFLQVVERVRTQINLPVAVKLGPYFTSLPWLAGELRKAGVSALVLFNRFYQLDIDVDNLKLKPGYQFSSSHELYTSLRWISILHGQVGCQLSASTGVHSAQDTIKMLLAGADTVQLCSTLYRHGVGQISEILDGIRLWMSRKGFGGVADFRGQLSQEKSGHPEAYERLQYIKALTGIG